MIFVEELIEFKKKNHKKTSIDEKTKLMLFLKMKEKTKKLKFSIYNSTKSSPSFHTYTCFYVKLKKEKSKHLHFLFLRHTHILKHFLCIIFQKSGTFQKKVSQSIKQS